MRPGTYATHAEGAAEALNQLLVGAYLPLDSVAIDQVLQCREGVLSALCERLYEMTKPLSDMPPEDLVPSIRASLAVEDISDEAVTLLHHVAFTKATLPWEERRRPTDYLTEATSDPAATLWQRAAIEMLTASNALTGAQYRPWLDDAGAGWWVIRDIAVALEAVTVLDARLSEVGLLNDHERDERELPLAQQRIVLSQAARVATWHATSDSPDAAQSGLSVAPAIAGPVELVAAVRDVAPAQQRLAMLLRPMVARDSAYTGDALISAASAQLVAAGQARLCRVFSDAAARSPVTGDLVGFFNERAEVFEDLQQRLSYLVDARPEEPSKLRSWQQMELVTSVTRPRASWRAAVHAW